MYQLIRLTAPKAFVVGGIHCCKTYFTSSHFWYVYKIITVQTGYSNELRIIFLHDLSNRVNWSLFKKTLLLIYVFKKTIFTVWMSFSNYKKLIILIIILKYFTLTYTFIELLHVKYKDSWTLLPDCVSTNRLRFISLHIYKIGQKNVTFDVKMFFLKILYTCYF